MTARVASLLGICAIAIATAGCRKASEPPPQQTPPSGEQITGNERIGWTQAASDPGELADFKYAIYVDGARSQLADVSCASTPAASGFDCTAALPKMTSGAHTLELAAFVDAGTVLESAKSAPLHVIVSAAVTIATAAPGASAGAAALQSMPAETSIVTSDGARLRIEVIARDLDSPADLAFVPDGRLFIAERSGAIRVVRDGRLLTEPAASIAEVRATDESALVAIAVDPHFDTTHFVYAIYSAPGRDRRPAFSLARFRESGGTLADRAILLEHIAAAPARPAASMRFGPDNELYAALDDGGEPARAGDAASFNGKILRMNPDATTPSDQAGGTPVFSYEYHSPRGIDWQSSSTLWIADAARGGTTRLMVVSAGAAPKRAVVVTTYSMPSLEDATAVGFYRGSLIPAFRNDLFIASGAGRHILRIHFDPNDRTRIVATERLLQDRAGAIQALAVGPDGTIYFSTTHELARILPAR